MKLFFLRYFLSANQYLCKNAMRFQNQFKIKQLEKYILWVSKQSKFIFAVLSGPNRSVCFHGERRSPLLSQSVLFSYLSINFIPSHESFLCC